MKHKADKNIVAILGTLIIIFVLLGFFFFWPMAIALRHTLLPLALILAMIFFILGLALILIASREKPKKMLKEFLLLTGFSAVGIFPSLILYNLTYGFFIYWFGFDFWQGNSWLDGSFLLSGSLFILPVVFLTGSVGSLALLIRKK